MTLNEYQQAAMKTCTKSSKNSMYMLFGLMEEVGEVSGKVAKAIRKGMVYVKNNELTSMIDIEAQTDILDKVKWFDELKTEIGDCLWMLSGLCEVLDLSLEDVARKNLNKLADRQKRGTIVGEGDNR